MAASASGVEVVKPRIERSGLGGKQNFRKSCYNKKNVVSINQPQFTKKNHKPIAGVSFGVLEVLGQ